MGVIGAYYEVCQYCRFLVQAPSTMGDSINGCGRVQNANGQYAVLIDDTPARINQLTAKYGGDAFSGSHGCDFFETSGLAAPAEVMTFLRRRNQRTAEQMPVRTKPPASDYYLFCLEQQQCHDPYVPAMTSTGYYAIQPRPGLRNQ